MRLCAVLAHARAPGCPETARTRARRTPRPGAPRAPDRPDRAGLVPVVRSSMRNGGAEADTRRWEVRTPPAHRAAVHQVVPGPQYKNPSSSHVSVGHFTSKSGPVGSAMLPGTKVNHPVSSSPSRPPPWLE